MKNIFLKSFLMLWVALGAIFFLTSCENDEVVTPGNILQVDDNDGYTAVNLAECQYNLDNMPLENLSEAEKNSILFMREEEKLARDVNLKFNEKWNLNVFDNISQSEQTHMDAMLQLIIKYNLTDPVGSNGVGVFKDDSLQALYNLLIPQGDASLIEALKAGALIEEVDILDLKNALANFVDNRDIEMVYENLYKASRNHLRAFVRNLNNRGVTYVPQQLTQDEFNEIIYNNWETGN